MKDLSYLSTLDAVAFEVERARLITDAIMGAPPEQQSKLFQFQDELNRVRSESTPEEFMVHCLRQAGELSENLIDQMRVLEEQVGFKPPVKAPAER